jgi:formate-dependent nitrite reductase membrane component NrfD
VTVQANPIRNTRYLRPQHHWGWQIAVYLYVAGIGAGSFIIGVIWDWLSYPAYPSTAILLWGVLLVPVGAFFLILDLGIKTRFMNAARNPRTSWLSRGFLILSGFIIFGVVTFALSLLPLADITVPLPLFRALEAISLVLAFITAIYTGILLQSFKYIPLWNTPLLPALFLVSALSTGSMVVILSTLISSLFAAQGAYHSQLTEMLTRTEQILVFVEAFVFGVFLFFRYKANEQGESSVQLLLSGRLKFVFWVGIIVFGFFFPIILEAIYTGIPEQSWLLYVTGFFLLVGGFFLRFGIVYAGIKEQLPMHKLIELQYNLMNQTRKDNGR